VTGAGGFADFASGTIVTTQDGSPNTTAHNSIVFEYICSLLDLPATLGSCAGSMPLAHPWQCREQATHAAMQQIAALPSRSKLIRQQRHVAQYQFQFDTRARPFSEILTCKTSIKKH
jgi:hypothetical protein